MIIKSKRNSKYIRDLEKEFEDSLYITFQRMEDEYLQLLSQGVRKTVNPLDFLISLGFSIIAQKMVEFLSVAYIYSYVDVAEQLKIAYEFERVNDYAIQEINRRLKNIDAMEETTKKQLVESLKDVLEGKKTYQEYLREAEEIIPFGRNRAKKIATHEIGSVYVEATNQAIKDYSKATGTVVLKQWSTVNDERVTAGCRFNESLGWIPDNATYGTVINPPRFIGCRCTLIYDVIVPDNKLT
jgi:hypothetical protein